MVMLIMVTKKIAGQESNEVILWLTARLVNIIMFAFVRAVGAKIK